MKQNPSRETICKTCRFLNPQFHAPGGVCTKDTPASTFSCAYRADTDGCDDWDERHETSVEICGNCEHFRPSSSVDAMGVCTHDLDLLREGAPFHNTGYRLLGGWPVTTDRRSCRRWAIKQSSS